MRRVCKRVSLLFAALAASPLILLTWLEALVAGKDSEMIFSGCREILSVFPTVIGCYLRKAFYWAVCTKVSPDAHFLFGCWLAHRENVVGAKVCVGAYTFIGYADIGESVLLGARVSVVSGKYQHGRPSQRTQTEGVDEAHQVIKIGQNSWIGQDVVIMANIGENCTVGAGSVVMRDVPDNTTVLGNPARKVNM